MKSIITGLSRISIPFYKKYKKEIQDIILFGSLLRGKLKPNDIDILIIFEKKVDKNIEYEYKKSILRLVKNVSLISKTSKTAYESSFSARESILFEGYSLIKREFVSSKFGLASLGIILYQTRDLNNVKKTQFYYALNGRGDSKGVLHSLNAIKLSDNILAVPLSNIEIAKEFFFHWDIEYTYVPALIPSRLGKRHIIGRVR